MNGLPDTDELTALAEAVVADGFDAHRAPLAELVAVARRLGLRPVLTEVLADEHAPRPVRERALGRLIVALCAAGARAPRLVTKGAVPAA